MSRIARVTAVTTGVDEGMLSAWLAYAVTGALLVAAAAVGVTLVAGPAVGGPVWLSAAIAYALQTIAFGALLRVRDRTTLFMAGWLGGMGLRFGVVGAVAFGAARLTTLPLAPLLLSLVGFVFVLVMLEPVFLRWDLRRR